MCPLGLEIGIAGTVFTSAAAVVMAIKQPVCDFNDGAFAQPESPYATIVVVSSSGMDLITMPFDSVFLTYDKISYMAARS